MSALKNELAIITECYADTNLIETLVPPCHRGYNHQRNCQKVGSTMKHNFDGAFALGIVDHDKVPIPYLKECDLIVNTGSLLLHKHKTQPHYIIQLSPPLERFMLNAAKDIGLSLKECELSDDLKELTNNHTKKLISKTDPKLKNAFKALKNAPSFALLRNWIEYLKVNTTTADVEVLKSMSAVD